MSIFDPKDSVGRQYGALDAFGAVIGDGRMVVQDGSTILLSDDGYEWLAFDMNPERAIELASIPSLGRVIDVEVSGYLRDGKMVRGYRRKGYAGADGDASRAFRTAAIPEAVQIPAQRRLPRSLGGQAESYAQAVQRLGAIGHVPPREALEGGWPAMRSYLKQLYVEGKAGNPARDSLPEEFRPGGEWRTQFRAYINPETLDKMGPLIATSYNRKAAVMEAIMSRRTIKTKGTMRGRTNYQLGQLAYGPGIKLNPDNTMTVNLAERAPFWGSFYKVAAQDVADIEGEYPGVTQTTILNIIAALSPGTVWGIPGSDKTDPHTNQGAARAVINELQRAGKVTSEWFETFADTYGGIQKGDDDDPAKKLKVTGDMLDKVNAIWTGEISLVTGDTFASAGGARKTANFANAISGNWDAYTVDRHDINMSLGVGYAEGTVHSPLEYDAAEISGRRLAADLGMEPSTFQAVTWGYQREIGVVVEAVMKDVETADIMSRLEQISPDYKGVKAAVARAIYRMRHVGSGQPTEAQVKKIKEELAKRFPADHPIWNRTLREVELASSRTKGKTRTVIALPPSLTGLSEDYVRPDTGPALDMVLASMLAPDTSIEEMLDALKVLILLASDAEPEQLGLAQDVKVFVDGYTREDGTYVKGHLRMVHRNHFRPEVHVYGYSRDPERYIGRVTTPGLFDEEDAAYVASAEKERPSKEIIRGAMEHVLAVHAYPTEMGPSKSSLGPFAHRYHQGTLGQFDGDTSEIRIGAILRDKPNLAAFVTVHELGHMFDHDIATHLERGMVIDSTEPDDQWQSDVSSFAATMVAMERAAPKHIKAASGPMADVMDTIRETPSFQRLQAMRFDERFEPIAPYVRYLLDPAEVFAQAYAQYIAVKRAEQGDTQLWEGMREMYMDWRSENLERIRALELTPDEQMVLGRVIDSSDFGFVRDSFDRLLSSYGLTRKGA